MSDNVVSIFKDNKAVVSQTPRKSMMAEKAAAAKSNFSFRRIQTNTNGTFKRLVNGEQVGAAVRGEINVIILNHGEDISRIYYKAKYDPEAEPTLPDCWSNLGVAPEPKVPNQQSKACITCPQNIKGSGEGADRRACRFQRRIAVLLENDDSGDVYQLNIPAKSIFGKGLVNGGYHYEAYWKFLAHNNEAVDTVVTTISYDGEADGMELLFTPVRQTTDEEAELVLEAQAKPECETYIKLTVAQVDGVSQEPKTIAAKAEEVKEVKEAEGPTTPEPTKRAKKKAAETPDADKSLADKIAAWD
jgi:hypothetical protein